MPTRPTALALLLLLSSAVAALAASCPVKRFPPGARIEAADLDEAFGKVAAAGKNYRFAYVAPTLADFAGRETLAGLKAQAERLGVTLEAAAPADPGSAAQQAELVRSMLAKAPDVLLVTPIDPTALKPVVDEATGRGIPVVAVGTAVGGARTFVGADDLKIGASAAEFLHELYPEGTTVVEIAGPDSAAREANLAKGFATGMGYYPGIVVATSAATDGSREQAKATAIGLLTAFPAIQGIYAHSDAMALGVLDAVKAVGRPSDVAVVGTGAAAAGWGAVKARAMRGTVAEFPERQGQLAVEVGLRLIACQTVPPFVVSPTAMITQKNIEDYAAPSQ